MKQRLLITTAITLGLFPLLPNQSIQAQSKMITKTTSGPIKLAYTDEGKGDTVLLFLPGWCANRTKFEPLLPLLWKKYRVISMDWRGHGESARVTSDFGTDELLLDALEVIHHCKAKKVIPVSVAHAGWVSIKLKETLADRVPQLIFIDWIVSDPPPSFLEALVAMQDPNKLQAVLDAIFEKWIGGVNNAQLIHFVKNEMGAYKFDMWSRGAREIQKSYTTYGSPLNVLSQLKEKSKVLHIYGQPDIVEYYNSQVNFSKSNSWFTVKKLNAKSHFPMFEIPEELSQTILDFLSME